MLNPDAIPDQEFTEKMIAFLQIPDSYQHTPSTVEIRQTHASILAIAPPYVYKVKKHVNLGFMDFTSLESRKTNAEREIHLNSRLCPSLYLGVIPITSKEGKLSFNGGGTIVDYALQMYQLEDGYFLDQLLEKGQVDTAIIESIVAKLAGFYFTQHRTDALQEYGSLANIRANVLDNLKGIEAYATDATRKAVLSILHSYVNTFVAGQTALFEKRMLEHRIKDCHGDLHLDHIHVKEDSICIYDCIEFNDHFRYSDVAADIAFLAMDLDFHHRPDLAGYVSSRMAELLKDPDMEILMDFYKCYRACVRAKVAGIQSAEAKVSDEEKRKSLYQANQYLQLALRYAVVGSAPMVLIVCGRVGTGKSTLAKKMAESMSLFYIGSDAVRKQQAGLPLYSRTSPEKRNALYEQEVSKSVYHTLLQTALEKVQHNQSLVLDATFSHQAYRQPFIEAFAKHQIQYLFLEMQATDETIKQRLIQRENSRQEVSDARLEDFERLSQSYQPLTEVSAPHRIQVNAGRDADHLLNEACEGMIKSRT
ncbi:AAA family ATPase [Rhodocytophaga rosea]|uniref:AAA family ATPase n=1 Tax=Rhodocytophaga rosea TaxID=2704465 RepID=A0A6C0GTR5_9BACT|nr:bifunctional aminoglycoside phosphotransferase/ATP-binding protein [Rhodocytophaga rosea]QHT71297.1 AAA family ATPase [Rhodocytophaga rosea]